MFPDVSEIELCGSGSRQSGDCTHEVASFSHRVNYDHDGVLPVRFQQLCYEINTGSVPGCIWDWERVLNMKRIRRREHRRLRSNCRETHWDRDCGMSQT